MTRFREYKPKQIDNIFLEFENFISDALRWAEFEIREDEMELPPNSSLIINDKGEIEDNPDYVDNRKNPHEIIEEIINGRVLESYFEQFINDVESHILNQIEGYKLERITTFFLKQIRFGREFEPEQRKPMIYRGFLSCLYNCQIPKEVQLTDNDKKLAKHLFDTYVKYFEVLKNRVIELKSEYPTPTNAQVKQPEQKKPKQTPQTLKECFKKEQDYENIMVILSDKKYIDPVNFRWIDKTEKSWKGKLLAFVKDMETKQYFKECIDLNWPIAQAIALNDFSVKIRGNKTYYNARLFPKETGIIPYCKE